MRRILLMMALLVTAGCGDKEQAVKTDTETAPAHSTNLNSQFSAGPQAPEEKFAEAKRKAESGREKDQLILARMYYNGDGVAKDDAKAAEWYQKAADKGNAFAQFKLGELYDKGEGVPKDAAKAAEWWKKAAEQGNDAAKEALNLRPAK